MSTTAIVIAVVVVVVLLIAAFILWRRERTGKLRSRFGPEYARTVEDVGSRRKAEAELRERQARVAAFSLRDLTAEDRTRFSDAWARVQAEFVDDPPAAVVHADVLLGDVMKARGYPVADFEQRAADISVDHPIVVENYRAAHDIAMRHTSGQATTEDLRQAMVHYRRLFEELTHGEAALQPAPAPAARSAR
ncbi:MAG: hypothetical protein JO111_15025 [Caulobacteraceae bacterium]|nr:hypothetical protein [Caulobacteraceae bacterium]